MVRVESISSRFYFAGEATYANEFYNLGSFKDRSEQW